MTKEEHRKLKRERSELWWTPLKSLSLLSLWNAYKQAAQFCMIMIDARMRYEGKGRFGIAVGRDYYALEFQRYDFLRQRCEVTIEHRIKEMSDES